MKIDTLTSKIDTHSIPDLSGELASFVCKTTWDHIPTEVRHEARRSLLNYFAVSLGACSDPTIQRAVRTFLPFSAGTVARLVGRPERFDILNASALNAMAANVYDFDDTHIPTILHPTAPIAPVLSALACWETMTGKDFLLAFVIGIEVECRIANAISPGHYARGWHITSTCGVFGSAAAAARPLKLDVTQVRWAFGSAAAQSSGLVEMLGTSAKSISVGNAARNGLLSALLAKEGFEGPDAPLEGPRGFLNVLGEKPNMSALKGGEAPTWELLRNTYKPYPCGVVLNPVIDACLMLADCEELQARSLDQIRSIEITGHPLLRQRTDRPNVTSGRQSQVSAQHAVGVVMKRRRAGLAEFSDAAVADPAVLALGAKVRFVDLEEMSIDAANVMVEFTDGSKVAKYVETARGSLARPMSDSEIENKLRELCHYGKSGIDASPLIDAIWSFEQCEDVSKILKLASPKE